MSQFEVVLVEDNPDHADLAVESLVSDTSGITTRHFCDGSSAIAHLREAARSGHGLPNLNLLDLNIPGLSGLDVLKAIKEDAGLALIPVVIVTTSRMASDIRAALSLHANSYATKSMDFSVWEASLRGIRDYWRDVDHSSDLIDNGRSAA